MAAPRVCVFRIVVKLRSWRLLVSTQDTNYTKRVAG